MTTSVMSHRDVFKPTDRHRAWRSGLIAAAGLAGAAGVITAAASAHVTGGGTLGIAANFLLVHATAALALAAYAVDGRRSKMWLALATAMLAAVTLFSGDLALFSLRGWHLFPMAAPLGGFLLIASWLAVFAAGAFEAMRPLTPPISPQQQTTQDFKP